MSVEHRVVGPPGTGKTTYLSRQCLRASETYGGDAIAIASLTRAAAKEIASRSTGVPLENIGTLHAHAYRRLERPALAETAEGVKEWNEACGVGGWQLSRRSVANPEHRAADELGTPQDGGDALLAEIQVLRARCVDSRFWPQRLQGFWGAWSDWKSERNRVDFTDLIEKGIEKVDGLSVGILMLDEAQDMSRLEMKLARKWGEAADQIVVCGDPDQNLYEWRGSDPDAFYDAEASTTRVLAQSYRVPRAVHQVAVDWIEQMPGRAPVEYMPRDEDGKVVRHLALCYKDSEAITKLLCERADEGTVMFIASCGYMVSQVIAGLRERGVPFHNPYRVANGAWNPLARIDRLLAYRRPDKDTWGDAARAWSWEDVHLWAGKLIAKETMGRGRKGWIEAKARARGRFDDQDEAAPLGSLLECFEPEHLEQIMEMRLDWWLEHLDHATRKAYRYPVEIALRRGPWTLRQTPRITVGTIHSVKGGEADSVVLAPDLSRAGVEDWMGRGTDAIRRMFYVGMTRAREELHLIGPAGADHVAL